ncbi:D-galactonate dehydratase family protein [Egibacter rhizosphaerae]|uniref:D-galactonate dehydratase family protein n=1 Tax=Egibacter rhizosphaerae TaxID=1670831 RepID=A0A411YED6_9ACTN|nr:D-mannonate dehydratase ManD [Egibacter rhizosphaerae]QBI19467.1 D-galactonate dehydratase family protein [Egibacter rhizosphaerae]
MRITDARTLVCSPGRNFVTLLIETDRGLRGYGDATLNGRELAVASYLDDHVLPLLIGRDATEIEDIWHSLYKGAYWRRGPVTMTAIGAVDVALWDLKGKLLDTPVYNLLGGRARRGVTVYGHANGSTIDGAIAAARGYIDMGYRAVRLQSGLPGLEQPYGVGRGDLYYEPAAPDHPIEETFEPGPYLRGVPQLFERARAELGWEVELLHDAHHRLTPREAAQLGKALEPYQLFWLEDPVPAEAQESLRLVRHHTVTPIAIGEVFNTIQDAHQLIGEQLLDYIRTTVAHAGGLTHLQRIAHLAELYHVRTACHGPTDLSPVNLGAALHFQTAVHNFGLQEYMRHPEEAHEVFRVGYWLEEGMLHVSDSPGLGVEVDEERAADFPYQRAYLPVARRWDGTVHSW